MAGKIFCSEHMMTGYYQRHCPNYWETFTRFQISPEANILVIDSLSDFEEILDEYWNAYKRFPNVRFLEYEWIIPEWDGIFLTKRGLSECAKTPHHLA